MADTILGASLGYSHLAAIAATTVKATPGALRLVSINSPGDATSTVTIQDGVATIAVISAATVGQYQFDVSTVTSLIVTIAGAASPDVTVIFA